MRRWLYDDAMYRFARPEPSLWEATAGGLQPQGRALAGNARCDVAIIGGGYTGLSAAYHLARETGRDVRVLDAGHIGWGASGRNGGFCSVGGEALGAETMIARYGIDNARAYYQSQVDGVRLVRELIEAEGIDAGVQGDCEVAIAVSPTGFERLKAHAELRYTALGMDASVVTADRFRERYFDSPLQHGAAVLRPTFGIHPLRYALGLAVAAERQGATLHPGSEVVAWSKNGDRHVLHTSGGSVEAEQVIVATNGFTPEHLHRQLHGRTVPMISSIVVTRPMSADELERHRWQTDAPSITSLRLLNYFRVLSDGRLMFGGRGSADGSDARAETNFTNLVARLHEVFPRWRDIDIEYRWHGLVCMNRRLTPALGQFPDDPTVFYGFGYHGNGVNTATWCGRQLARWLANASTIAATSPPDGTPAVVCGLPPRVPLAAFRLAYVQAAIRWFRYRDSKV